MDLLLPHFEKLLDAEVSRNTLAFLVAAWLHRGWVKKDMKENFALIKESIDKLTEAMKSHNERLDDHEVRLEKLEKT